MPSFKQDNRMAAWPSGKARDCKSELDGFDHNSATHCNTVRQLDIDNRPMRLGLVGRFVPVVTDGHWGSR